MAIDGAVLQLTDCDTNLAPSSIPVIGNGECYSYNEVDGTAVFESEEDLAACAGQNGATCTVTNPTIPASGGTSTFNIVYYGKTSGFSLEKSKSGGSGGAEWSGSVLIPSSICKSTSTITLNVTNPNTSSTSSILYQLLSGGTVFGTVEQSHNSPTITLASGFKCTYINNIDAAMKINEMSIYAVTDNWTSPAMYQDTSEISVPVNGTSSSTPSSSQVSYNGSGIQTNYEVRYTSGGTPYGCTVTFDYATSQGSITGSSPNVNGKIDLDVNSNIVLSGLTVTVTQNNPSRTFNVKGSFSSQSQNATFTMQISIEGGGSKTLSWPVSAGGSNRDTKQVSLNPNKKVSITLSCTYYPATLSMCGSTDTCTSSSYSPTCAQNVLPGTLFEGLGSTAQGETCG